MDDKNNANDPCKLKIKEIEKNTMALIKEYQQLLFKLSDIEDTARSLKGQLAHEKHMRESEKFDWDRAANKASHRERELRFMEKEHYITDKRQWLEEKIEYIEAVENCATESAAKKAEILYKINDIEEVTNKNIIRIELLHKEAFEYIADIEVVDNDKATYISNIIRDQKDMLDEYFHIFSYLREDGYYGSYEKYRDNNKRLIVNEDTREKMNRQIEREEI